MGAASLHLEEKAHRICQSLLACYNQIISIVPGYREIQESNSVLTHINPRVTTSEDKTMTFKSAAQLSLPRHIIKFFLPVLNIFSLSYAISSQNNNKEKEDQTRSIKHAG